jgi:hypothetical protein
VGVVSSIVDDDKFVVTSSGYIEEGLSGLTAGSVYYLSASTAGLLTLTEPGVIGHVSKPMLLADSATSGYVLQYRGVLVGAVFGEDTPLNADNLTEGTINPARLPASLYRNRVINGDCRVAQRGAVPVVNGVFTYGGADRVYCITTLSASITGSLTKSAFTSSSSGFGQWITNVNTTATSGAIKFGQRLEGADVADLNSKTVTFSAKVYQDTGSTQLLDVKFIRPAALDNFAGGTVSFGTSSNIPIPSGVPTEVSVTLTLGSGDATNGLAFEVSFKNFGAVTNKNFGIADMQLVEGSVVSPFESRPYGYELMLCQRYFYSIFKGIFGIANSASMITASVILPTSMRIPPTPSLTIQQVRWGDMVSQGYTLSSATIEASPYSSEQISVLRVTGTGSAFTTYRTYLLEPLSASFGTIQLSAEL